MAISLGFAVSETTFFNNESSLGDRSSSNAVYTLSTILLAIFSEEFYLEFDVFSNESFVVTSGDVFLLVWG